jgi:DNA-directed RNA polymerase subunit beta
MLGKKLNSKLNEKNFKSLNIFVKYPYVSTTPEAWKEIAKLFNLKKIFANKQKVSHSLIKRTGKKIKDSTDFFLKNFSSVTGSFSKKLNFNFYTTTYKNRIKRQFSVKSTDPPFPSCSPSFSKGALHLQLQLLGKAWEGKKNKKKFKESLNFSSLGRKWFFQRFMNPRTYDLGYKGRFALNKKLNLTISPNQTTLTAQDLLFSTDYLMKVEKGIHPVDDIDHLKNKRIRSAGELIQMQFGVGLMRLEKTMRLKLNAKPKKSKIHHFKHKGLLENLLRTKLKQKFLNQTQTSKVFSKFNSNNQAYNSSLLVTKEDAGKNSELKKMLKRQLVKNFKTKQVFKRNKKQNFLALNSIIQPKFVNGALKEFFGTHPLSQFMDQINPLAELTHKRRITSLGPGGVARDTATLAIRGIHPSHYGRICPIETPEGKNTGLVNSLTVYARVNLQGFIQSPFQLVYKGQIQKTRGRVYLSADQEENFQIATPDLNITEKTFLPKQKIPVRFGKNFSNYSTKKLSFVGISPLQMISVATALIPFLEHDDANRALMGSNMQRQAVPLIRPERPLVGTGLEAKVISDSGHAITTSHSGFIFYASGSQIMLYTNETLNDFI